MDSHLAHPRLSRSFNFFEAALGSKRSEANRAGFATSWPFFLLEGGWWVSCGCWSFSRLFGLFLFPRFGRVSIPQHGINMACVLWGHFNYL